MFKKLTAYCLIILANIVLVAHAVLPHHHHEQMVCDEPIHRVDNSETNSPNFPGHPFEHNDSNNSTCTLNQTVLFPSSQNSFFKSWDKYSDHANQNLFTHSNLGNVDIQPRLFPLKANFQFISFYISNVTPTLGLRAPPIV